jgi:hypothetical protein
MADQASTISALLKDEFERHGEDINISSVILNSRRPEIRMPYLVVAPDVTEADLALPDATRTGLTVVPDPLPDRAGRIWQS